MASNVTARGMKPLCAALMQGATGGVLRTLAPSEFVADYVQPVADAVSPVADSVQLFQRGCAVGNSLRNPLAR